MSRRVLDFSKLNDLVLDALRSTEDVKNILQSQCDEAKYVLAPWKFETITQKEVDGDSCSCPKTVSTEEHVKEIASGIDRAVEQARNLREKLASNVSEEKKLVRRPSVREIYAPGSAGIGSKTRLVETKGGKENEGRFKKSDNQRIGAPKTLERATSRSLVGKNSKTLNVNKPRGGEGEKKTDKVSEPKRIRDKKLVETSPYNSLAAASKTEQKSKGKKNFIASNKSSIKNMRGSPNLKNEAQSSSDSPVSSAAELGNLISKIFLESENSAVNLAGSNGCPVHDINAPKYFEEKVSTSVDAAEGLDRFGVPSELVKSLRVYHSYLNSNQPTSKKGYKSAEGFLSAFNTMNRNRRRVSAREKLDNLCTDFLPVLKESFKKNIDFIELSRVKIRYTDLDTTCKALGLRSLSPTKRLVSRMIENRSADRSGSWKLNAVWNKACVPSLEGMSRVRCIRYSNRNQLLALFQYMQQIQQLKYRGKLADLLVEEILPMLRDALEPESQEFARAYKTISTICSLINPKVPILYRMNEFSTKMMETQYVYTKTRAQFGRWCSFSECGPKTEVNIPSEPSLMHSFVRKDPITQGTQCSKIFAEHEVNTTTATYREGNMRHVEGGWPKDVNTNDLEQTVRYRRKIEKDELYIHTMLQLLPPMEHYILQNNACDIYEQYFNDTDAAPLVQKTFSRTVNVYRDPLPMKRSITHLSWSPDQGTRLAISYCDTDFKKAVNSSPNSYIWDVENPNNPFMALKPFCPNLTIEYNPKDSNALVSGMTSGQVASWDIRRGSEPVETSLVEQSHREPCHKVLWINSKTGTEFFSASNDGQIKWWDTRKLQNPTETLVIDLLKPEEQEVGRATGISALQFEASMGTRFMCGLENGMVISGNRKGKTPGEKIAIRFKAQYGPVISVERNPTFVKNFLTVGDWTARIWSEDCRESCIAWTPGHRDLLTSGAWSTTRFSVFFLTKMDGTMDVWDILVQQDSPVLSVKVCDEALTCIRPHEHGHLAAVASRNGTTYLVEFSEALTINQKNDKLLLTALLERETRREKVIEAKNRETRLKLKSGRMDLETDAHETQNQNAKADSNRANDVLKLEEQDPAIIQCEQDYLQAVEAEIIRQTSLENSEVNNNHLQNGIPAAH